jgi:hypothetical protein
MKKITVKILFVTALVIGCAAGICAQNPIANALAGKLGQSIKVKKLVASDVDVSDYVSYSNIKLSWKRNGKKYAGVNISIDKSAQEAKRIFEVKKKRSRQRSCH